MNQSADFLMNSTVGGASIWPDKSNLNTLLGRTSRKSIDDFDYRDLKRNMDKLAPGQKNPTPKQILQDPWGPDDEYNATPFVNASPTTKRKNFDVTGKKPKGQSQSL